MLTVAAASAITVSLILGWTWSNRERLRLPSRLQGDVDGTLLPKLERWQQRAPGVGGGVVLGDSRADCEHGVTVGTALEQRLRAAGRPTEVADAAHPLFRPLHFYYLLGEVLAGKPTIAVIEVNTAVLWPHPPPFLRSGRFVNLSRKLSPRRAWRIRSVLAGDEITLFDPFLYRLEEKADLLFVVDGVRDVWEQRINRYGTQVNRLLDLAHDDPPKQSAYRAERAKLEEILRAPGTGEVADHFATVVLREMHRELGAAGAEVLFYLPPGRPRSHAEARDDRIIEAVRVAVGATPDQWLDLRRLLPPGEFRDVGGHMVPSGCERVAGALYEALAARPR